ncbi:hypothetical protein [Flavobacterium sp. '19STA2R22 D10 B1']|uniref:hypothetical protein n=1 Tax=Flavobacterium aerium TaxID=3037261 RepID=UPI00278C480D|nr:hypothetical protein [Flavobacterium sp. '19STA2R22 D10 B1']
MKNKEFNLLEWHDATLKCINIDRSNPGYNDSIEIDIVWPSGGENKLIFKDVYSANFSLNFGVIAEESILGASIIDNSNVEIIKIKEKWSKLYDGIKDLYGFEIKTASTASNIKIFALSFSLENV